MENSVINTECGCVLSSSFVFCIHSLRWLRCSFVLSMNITFPFVIPPPNSRIHTVTSSDFPCLCPLLPFALIYPPIHKISFSLRTMCSSWLNSFHLIFSSACFHFLYLILMNNNDNNNDDNVQCESQFATTCDNIFKNLEHLCHRERERVIKKPNRITKHP